MLVPEKMFGLKLEQFEKRAKLAEQQIDMLTAQLTNLQQVNLQSIARNG
jgi:hypothetical protein